MKTVDIIGYNYLGPYVSGGKFQKSVKDSLVRPVDRLDADARVHDIAYATYEDFGHRLAADKLFCRYAGNSKMAKLASAAVTVGNTIPRFLPSRDITHSRFKDYLKNQERYIRDIEKLYEEDLYWSEFNAVGVKEMIFGGEEQEGGYGGNYGNLPTKPRDKNNLNLRGTNSVIETKDLKAPNGGFAITKAEAKKLELPKAQAPVLSKSSPNETLTTYSEPREAPKMIVSEIESSGEANASAKVNGSSEAPQACYVGDQNESGVLENVSEKPTTSGVNNVQYCDSYNCNNRSIAQIGAPRSVYYFQNTQYSKKKRKRRRKKKYVFL